MQKCLYKGLCPKLTLTLLGNMQTANRVAINTIVQYTRLVLNLVIALVSVRIILNSLGASDYGVYDVVGGVITLLGFLNSSLSQTSIRYLSVSLGEKKLDTLRRTFNNCFWLHFIIAILMVVALEAVGLFLFDGFLNIPSARIYAAQIVYHCMILTTFLQVAVTPFQALIISHEKFMFTSCVSIVDSLLKLAIALVLGYTMADKLIVYGGLMALVTVLNTIAFVGYIVIVYRQEMYIGKLSILGIKEQSQFAGWTILDILGSMFNRQGYTIMLNKFFGTYVNSSFAIARQVEGQVYSISSAIIDTIKPQIMKSYGANDTLRMFRLSMTAGKFGFIFMSFVCIPLLVCTSEILTLWLKNVPDGSVTFIRLLIGACMMEQVTRGLVYASQATGKIKWFSIVVSTIRMCALPVSIVFCLGGSPAYVPLIVFFICETIGSFSRIFIITIIHGGTVIPIFKDIIFKIAPPFVITLFVCHMLKSITSGFSAIIIVCVSSMLIYSCVSYVISLSKEEKAAVNSIVQSFIRKKNV